jgi:hypothetical protein
MPKGEHLKEKQVGVQTRFTQDRQPDNRRTPDTISALLKQELASDGWATFEDAEVLNEDGKPTGQKVAVRVKLTTAQAVAKRLLANAAKGRERSIEIVLERTEGKVPQDFNMGGKDGGAIQVEMNFENLSTDELKTFIALTEKAERMNDETNKPAGAGNRKAGTV